MKKSKRRQRRGALRHGSEGTAETMESIELVRVMWNPARPNNFETHSRYIGPKTSSNAVAMAARAALEEMVEKSCLDRDEAKRQIMNKVALALGADKADVIISSVDLPVEEEP